MRTYDFCREIVKKGGVSIPVVFPNDYKAQDEVDKAVDLTLPHVLKFLQGDTPKFILPFNGVMLGYDVDYVIDEKNFKLPYPVTILEFETGNAATKEEVLNPFKVVVVATQKENDIIVLMIIKENKDWMLYPCSCRLSIKDTVDVKYYKINVRQQFSVFTKTMNSLDQDYLKELSKTLAISTRAVAQLILSLNCKNISDITIPISKTKMALGGKTKGYSEYHVLKVTPSERANRFKNKLGGTHASPREHMRRGHIHRFKMKEGFISHWIDAMVVNAGIGGCVTKDYLLL